jgi:hypothetical protein
MFEPESSAAPVFRRVNAGAGGIRWMVRDPEYLHVGRREQSLAEVLRGLGVAIRVAGF